MDPNSADDPALESGVGAWDSNLQLDEGQLSAVADALLVGAEGEVAEARHWAEVGLRPVFPEAHWGITLESNPFSEAGKRGLYRNEIPGEFKAWLTQQRISEAEYADAIAAIQFNSISIWATKLFAGRARANRGWRIRLLGFPSLDTIAVGIASHYQGSQSQNELGRASALIRNAAIGQLSTKPDAREAIEAYAAATAEHWDGSGLMPNPIRSVGSLDISGYGHQGAQLRMARNTTAKKDIAAFFCIVGMNKEGFFRDGATHLSRLHLIASVLAEDAI